ncbi:hypothetical protein [Marinobacterium jannaschii]|uniref:hypothetical protein n=1 Tax=Marinobacterium jannaschii TaxID=64970 RepID=UPI00048735FE|nr:hypothetical protein [Marinobacterium jannaschii]
MKAGLITRETAILEAGQNAVEAVEAMTCNETNAVGYQGLAGGDELCEWAARTNCEVDGIPATLTAYYYTTNSQDQEIAEGCDIDWQIAGYTAE